MESPFEEAEAAKKRTGSERRYAFSIIFAWRIEALVPGFELRKFDNDHYLSAGSLTNELIGQIYRLLLL